MTNNSLRTARGEYSDTSGEYSTPEIEGDRAELSTNLVTEHNVQMAPGHPTEDEATSWDPGIEARN